MSFVFVKSQSGKRIYRIDQFFIELDHGELIAQQTDRKFINKATKAIFTKDEIKFGDLNKAKIDFLNGKFYFLSFFFFILLIAALIVFFTVLFKNHVNNDAERLANFDLFFKKKMNNVKGYTPKKKTVKYELFCFTIQNFLKI